MKDKRSANLSDEPVDQNDLLPVVSPESVQAHADLVADVDRDGVEATHGRYECPGCEKVETYPLTQAAAREVVKRHIDCKHGARQGVKQRLSAGINLWPKRRK